MLNGVYTKWRKSRRFSNQGGGRDVGIGPWTNISVNAYLDAARKVETLSYQCDAAAYKLKAERSEEAAQEAKRALRVLECQLKLAVTEMKNRVPAAPSGRHSCAWSKCGTLSTESGTT